MRLLRHELYAIAAHPMLWTGALALCVFLLYAVAHLSIDENKVSIGFYHTQLDDSETKDTLKEALLLAKEVANIQANDLKELKADGTSIAAQMIADDVDIAVSRSRDGWRFTVKSRSVSEHSRLVRVAQTLGASVSQRKPWFLVAYEQLSRKPESPAKPSAQIDDEWPIIVRIAGITADPDRHARVFIPKTIALLAYFVTFAFACRSMIRDISSNTIPTLLVSAGGRWLYFITAKIVICVLMGIFAFALLLLVATIFYGFEFKGGFLPVATAQVMGLLASASLGIATSLFVRTESRIYFVASAYLVLLVLLSGLIAKIDPSERLLVVVSQLLPLGYTMDVMSNWMFFGTSISGLNAPLQALLLLLLLSILLVCASVMFYRRHI